jgi:hypothetical protein
VVPDLAELSLGATMKTHFPDPDDILNFKLTIDPDEGMYKGGRFEFDFKINQNFPHDPPKVKCTQKIYHPNIDLEGNVCLNILREDWKPVLNLNAAVVGLQVCDRGVVGEWSGILMLTRNVVSLPRTQRVRPTQQGGSRRPQGKPGRVQAQRARFAGRRHGQGTVFRPRAEVGKGTSIAGRRQLDGIESSRYSASELVLFWASTGAQASAYMVETTRPRRIYKYR